LTESVVRPAKPEDVPRIWDLVRQLAEYERLAHLVTGTAEDLHRWIFEEPTVFCLVAEVDAKIRGYALFFRNFSTFLMKPGVYLEDVFVEPAFRGNGLGKALLRSVIDWGRQAGCGRVEWSVLDWNVSAISFYESMGAAVLSDWRICRICLS
jgi:GNAT superfamily N-acetyltransferase